VSIRSPCTEETAKAGLYQYRFPILAKLRSVCPSHTNLLERPPLLRLLAKLQPSLRKVIEVNPFQWVSLFENLERTEILFVSETLTERSPQYTLLRTKKLGSLDFQYISDQYQI